MNLRLTLAVAALATALVAVASTIAQARIVVPPVVQTICGVPADRCGTRTDCTSNGTDTCNSSQFPVNAQWYRIVDEGGREISWARNADGSLKRQNCEAFWECVKKEGECVPVRFQTHSQNTVPMFGNLCP